jgi:hypothetical protein
MRARQFAPADLIMGVFIMDIPMLRKVTLPDGRQLRNIDIVIARVNVAIHSKKATDKIIIVIAGTSSGKTITIPSALHEIRPNIIVTMPTIVLVKETASDLCKYVRGFEAACSACVHIAAYYSRPTACCWRI